MEDRASVKIHSPTDCFTVEHNRGGRSFEKIGSHHPAGTTAAKQFHEFGHAEPSGAENHHRLRRVDVDGRASLGDVMVRW